MTIELIEKYAKKIQQNKIKYDTEKAYASGNHVAILQPLPKSSPDNRIVTPFIKRAIAMMLGYIGKVGNTVYTGDYYENTLKPVYNFNDEELLNSIELEDAMTHGVCYELHWVTDGIKYFRPMPVDQVYIIYDDTLLHQIIGAVWLREIDEVYTATYYDSLISQEFTKEEKGKWSAGPEVRHGYKQVPINVGQIARNGANLFNHVLGLVDLYDALMSGDIANELEKYSGALMLMAERIDTTTADDQGRKMVDRIKEMKLIDGLDPSGSGDIRGKVAYLTRDIPTDFIKFALEMLKQLIPEMLMVNDFNDASFNGASGFAQEMKLVAMENNASSICSYFMRFLQNRIKLIAGISGSLQDDTTGASDVTIEIKRNLPHDLSAIADVMAKLNGLISQRANLRLLPTTVIPDIEAEIKAKSDEGPTVDLIGDTETDPNNDMVE